jgi:hypothetical protein
MLQIAERPPPIDGIGFVSTVCAVCTVTGALPFRRGTAHRNARPIVAHAADRLAMRVLDSGAHPDDPVSYAPPRG